MRRTLLDGDWQGDGDVVRAPDGGKSLGRNQLGSIRRLHDPVVLGRHVAQCDGELSFTGSEGEDVVVETNGESVVVFVCVEMLDDCIGVVLGGGAGDGTAGDEDVVLVVFVQDLENRSERV